MLAILIKKKEADLTSFNRDKFTAVSALSIHPDLGHFSYNFGYQALSFGFFGFPLL
jgi:hypothetical protein